MGDVVNTDRRSSERRHVHAKVEFFIEGTGDLLSAESVNISEEGIRFETDEPLMLSLRYDLDGKTHLKIGRLVWARSTDEGKMTYGLDFVKQDGK